MEETLKGLLSRGAGDYMVQTSTQAVSSAARWKNLDSYSRLLIEEFHIVQDDEP